MGIKLTPAATDSKRETFAFCLGCSKRESDKEPLNVCYKQIKYEGEGGGGR